MKFRRFHRSFTLVVCSVMVMIGLWIVSAGQGTVLYAQQEPSAAPNAGADLAVTAINTSPEEIGPGLNIDITPIIKNLGDEAAPQVQIYLYVELGAEPTTETEPTARFTFGLPLAAGATFNGWTSTGQPITQNNPYICVWVDPLNTIAEDDEENNLFCLNPPVEPNQDQYDDVNNQNDDDTCSNATAITSDGVPQAHNLFRTANQDDVDWVKFEGESGVKYTIEGKPDPTNGTDANLTVSLWPNCDTPSFGTGAKVSFTAPTSQTYYVQITNRDSGYGPNTDYTVAVTRQQECADDFEPNNSCNLPVDFPLSAGTQSHSFCKADDEDWIRFEVKAGGEYKISTETIGANADPQLSIFGSCDQTNLPGQAVQFVAPTTGYYYIKAENKNQVATGSGTEYNVKIDVLQSGCDRDDYEQAGPGGDDKRDDAQNLQIDGSTQTHNICPQGDQDWVKIDATSGVSFTVETLNLQEAADTYLCLYDRSGNKLACDRDSGAGLGSRVTIQADDTLYYARVTDEDESVAGKTTEYRLRAVTSQDADRHEPDDERGQAKALVTDGTTHEHNIHRPNDTDWVKFTAKANTSYTIKTTQSGEEGDTEITLYDSAGNTIRRNDDYQSDASSRIVVDIGAAGEYFVRMRLYNPSYYGAGTEYALQIVEGRESDPEPPVEEEAPDKEKQPPGDPTNVQTLILVNRSRMGQLHGNVDALMAKLTQLAAHPKVQGEIIDLNRNDAVANAYAEWLATAESQKDVEKANMVADAIRRLVMTYLAERAGVKYIVLVGTDQALPFRRVVDATPQLSEKTYTKVNDNHPTGSAIRRDYFLTDDFYIDREPISNKGREIYVPDPGLSIGRLIEEPADMINLINIFLANPVTQIDNVFVSGYDFVKDSATEDCISWRKLLDPDGSNSEAVKCVISENWRKGDLLDSQMSTNPVYKIQSINGHADHYAQGVPDNSLILGTDIAARTVDLAGGLIYTLACHGGLNVPDDQDSFTTDLVESFVMKGANYVGNTGYGWGYRGSIGLSEQMMQLFTARLVKGGAMGPALSEAKAEYYKLTKAARSYDEKVMQQLIFYGLPMFEHGQGTLGDVDPFAGLVGDDFQQSLNSETQFSEDISFQFVNQTNPDQEIFSLNGDDENGSGNTFGTYQSLAAYSYAEEGQPVQPLYFKNVTQAASEVRSVVIRSATIDTEVLENFDPIVATPDNEFVTPEEAEIAGLSSNENGEVVSAWFPANVVDVQALDGESLLSTKLGQFNPATNEQRNFQNMDVDVYYSLSSDTQGPEVTLVTGLIDGTCDDPTLEMDVRVKVGVTDPSGIEEVTLQYFQSGPTSPLASLNMTYEASSQKWIGTFRGSCAARFQVSAMDKAFNRTLENNKGERYAPVPALGRLAPAGAANTIYLPIVTR